MNTRVEQGVGRHAVVLLSGWMRQLHTGPAVPDSAGVPLDAGDSAAESEGDGAGGDEG